MRRLLTATLATVLVPAVLAGICIDGPASLRWAYRRDVGAAVARVAPEAGTITAQDLARLPAPVQRYLQSAGVIAGSPKVQHLYARMHGRIRSGPAAPWLSFTAEQHNFFDQPARLFYMDAWKGVLPIQGFHRYVGTTASMRIELIGVIPLVAVSGGEMTPSETVTLLNDMAVLAPATLISPAIAWEPVDAGTARAAFTNAGQTVRATLEVDDAGALANFWSDDRRQASPDGRTMRALRWSTPLSGYRTVGAFRLAGRGEGRWHERAGEYAYVEIEIDDVRYNAAARLAAHAK